MTAPATKPSAPPPSPPFQFSLRTLLLLFVVLGSSLGVFGAWGTVVFALVVVLGVGIQQTKTLSSLAFVALVAFCLICFLVVLLMPLVIEPRGYGRRTACLNRLRNLASAVLYYQDRNGHLPPAYVADKTGKPMHSWRVLILPCMEYDTLYKTCDLTQSWDAPKNKKQLAIEPQGVCLPERPGHQRARSDTDKLLCRGGVERRLGRRDAEEGRRFGQ